MITAMSPLEQESWEWWITYTAILQFFQTGKMMINPNGRRIIELLYIIRTAIIEGQKI
jgi:hypothetical protein